MKKTRIAIARLALVLPAVAALALAALALAVPVMKKTRIAIARLALVLPAVAALALAALALAVPVMKKTRIAIARLALVLPAVAALALAAVALAVTLPRAHRAGAAAAAPRPLEESETPRVDRESLAGRSFEFHWRSDDGGALNGIATLRADGTIRGIASPNESTWTIDAEGRLLFKHSSGRVSTRYDRVKIEDGRLRFEGPFLFRDGIVHALIEVEGSGRAPESRITPEEAERIRYSKQRFVYLDPGESISLRLDSGEERSIRLESVDEIEDSVIGLARRAAVVVAIDGQRLELACAPYAMPSEAAGLRIQADTTTAWLEMPKRVQLSVWDASHPIVDTRLFGFPLPGYRLFSHGMQAYNEPVHLGDRDGDPDGQRFHHNYGVDLAGYEGRQKVVSAIDGTVAQVYRDEGTLSVRDERGVILVYCHLDSILPEIQVGARVKRGQWVGMLGRRGGSGNFSHLHVGIYLSESDMIAGRMNRNINLYPWLVAAYLESSGAQLCSVARPHHAVRTGETVILDGSSSLAAGAPITSYEWVFHDGSRSRGPRAEKVYDRPGTYQAALWVESGRGARDVDFATVRVFSRDRPEGVMPTLFATFTPAGGIRAGDPVSFRLWPQGMEMGSIRIDFGDGTVLDGCRPYSAVAHIFRRPGVHVVTATASAAGLPVEQKLAVVVAGD